MRPASVKIVTDSTNDLTPELLSKYDISVIPLYTVLDEESYRDGVDIDCERLLAWCNNHKTTPKTAAVSVVDFTRFFSPFIQQGQAVVYIGISSEISSTVQNARLAAQEFAPGQVEVVDSLNLSTGIGYLALEAAELARQGKSAGEIREAVEAMVPKMNVSFVIDTLTFLYRGGRCSALQYLGANMLSLKPEIIVREGKMTTRRKYRGSIAKALGRYTQDHLAEGQAMDPRRIIITHSPMEADLVAQVRKQVEETGYFDEVLTTQAGCVITSHCGANTLGVIYMDR